MTEDDEEQSEDDAPTDDTQAQKLTPDSPLIVLRGDDGSPLVTIDRNGSARFPLDAPLDELSRRFWEAVAGQQGVLSEIRGSLVVYLSGPVDGLPNGNIPTFRSAAQILRQSGYQVVDITQTEGFSRYDNAEQMMRNRVAALMGCNAVALLPGWPNSFACQLEVEIATACGMTVAPVDYWLVEPTR